MRVDPKSLLLGAAGTVAAIVAAFMLLMRAGSSSPAPMEQHHRTLKLASGRALEVMALSLYFGDEHSQRGAADDAVVVEYVAASGDEKQRDDDAAQVFEAVRPLADSLGLETASVSAFPSAMRKGHYVRSDYSRDQVRGWSFKRVEAKVSANEP